MATTPILGGTTLPNPTAADGFSETLNYRGGLRRMADGSATIDLVASGVKRRFRLSWPGLTDTQKGTVTTAYATIDDSSASFTAPTGSVYTVNRDPDSPGLTFDAFMIGGGALRWRCTMYLEEA